MQENQPAGTAVGSFSTTDSNGGDTFTYTLVSGAGSSDNASFTIGGDTLEPPPPSSTKSRAITPSAFGAPPRAAQWVEKPFTVTVIDVNVEPNAPTNLAPVDSAANVPLAVTLQASAFSDPNPGDSQAASEWVVQRAADSSVVIDSGTDVVDTTSYSVPAGLLGYLTAYTWQVRFQDNHGAWSSFSIPTGFTTAPPSLAVTAVQGNVIVSWPTNADGFFLECSTDLSSTNWNPVLTSPFVIGTQNVVTNATTNPASFYRLHQQ